MTPEILMLVLIMAGMTLYALLAGADFGAGVWEFNTALKASEEERELLYGAIGPVWEANHVWLIFVLTGLFTAFPAAFAALSRALWIPFLLAVVGIVFRGVAYAFRSTAAGAMRTVWGAVFAFASTAAPFFLGAAAGAAASGRLAVTPDGGFTGDVLLGWIRPLSIHGALFGTGACAYLAAVYLARECSFTKRTALCDLWRRRALLTGCWVGALSLAGLLVMRWDAPLLWAGFKLRAWPLLAASAAAGLASLGLLWKRRFTLATGAAGLSVATVLWGWGVAQYPMLVLPSISVSGARAPEAVLRASLWGILLGSAVVVPSLTWLMVLFKARRSAVP